MRARTVLIIMVLIAFGSWFLASAGISRSLDDGQSSRDRGVERSVCQGEDHGCEEPDDDDESDDDEDSVCEMTAKRVRKACSIDVKEEWLLTRAACDNIGDAEERDDCEELANETREEESEFCEEQEDAREETCELLDEDRYDPDPLVDPDINFIDPDDVPGLYDPNPYVSVVAGHTFVLSGGDEIVVVHVTDETKEINGVPCRVVVDVVLEAEGEEDELGAVEYVPVELTDDWFAQSDIGDVYYCGEIALNFEDGDLVDLDGSFRSGVEYAKGGLLTAASPTPGDVHRQEYFLDEAEDVVQYIALDAVPTEEMGGDNDDFPCEPNGCLQTFDFAPLEPESTEFKFYKAGVGFVLGVGMEDGELTGERELLTCVGDSLAVLGADGGELCGIDDPDALLDVLCELAPTVFCVED